jgi:hypothetical protein
MSVADKDTNWRKSKPNDENPFGGDHWRTTRRGGDRSDQSAGVRRSNPFGGDHWRSTQREGDRSDPFGGDHWRTPRREDSHDPSTDVRRSNPLSQNPLISFGTKSYVAPGRHARFSPVQPEKVKRQPDEFTAEDFPPIGLESETNTTTLPTNSAWEKKDSNVHSGGGEIFRPQNISRAPSNMTSLKEYNNRRPKESEDLIIDQGHIQDSEDEDPSEGSDYALDPDEYPEWDNRRNDY